MSIELTKQEKAKLLTFKRESAAIIKRIGIERDKLRALVDDVSDVLETVDTALDGFESDLDTLSGML